MNILVFFKIVPDFDRVLPNDWEDFSYDSDLFYARKILNIFDESALEIALSLCEELNKVKPNSATCTAATLAPSLPNSFKKNLFAVGFDKLILLKNEHTEFAHEQTASILCQFLEKNSFDLILTGLQSGYADTGLVPSMIAAKMNISLICNAESISLEDKQFSAIHQGDFGKMKTPFSTPALVSVGNSPLALRAATLKNQLLAAKKEVVEYTIIADDFVFNKPYLYTEKQKKDCLFFEKEDKKDAIAMLFNELWDKNLNKN